MSKIIYISSSIGNDDNDGLSKARPIKTIKKLNSIINRNSLSPGDRVLFKRGDVWDEVFIHLRNIHGSGSRRIIFGAYGDIHSEELPRFNNLVELPDWKNKSRWKKLQDNVWEYQSPTLSIAKKAIRRLWLDNKEYMMVHTSEKNKDVNTDMGWSKIFRWNLHSKARSNPFKLGVFVPTDKHPVSYYKSIKYTGKYDNIFKLENCSYITIEDFEIEGGGDSVFDLYKSKYCVIRDITSTNFGNDAVHIRYKGADYNKVLNCVFDTKLDEIVGGPLPYEIEDMNLVDIWYGASYNEVAYTKILGGGISHFRVFGHFNKEGAPTGNSLHDCYLWSANGWSKSISINYGGKEDDSSKYPKDTLIYNNIISTRGQAQIGGHNTKIFYNIFYKQEGDSDLKVLHHNHDPQEGYAPVHNDKSLTLNMDKGSLYNVDNVYFFNNTFYKIGRWGIEVPHKVPVTILNNLFVDNSTRYDKLDNAKIDMRIALDKGNYVIKNNYSFNSTGVDKRIIYGYYKDFKYPDYVMTYSELEKVINKNFKNNASGNTVIKTKIKATNIFKSEKDLDFQLSSKVNLFNKGVSIKKLLPDNFVDRYKNKVDPSKPNIGAACNEKNGQTSTTLLNVPTNVSVTVLGNNIRVSWDDINSSEMGYEVFMNGKYSGSVGANETSKIFYDLPKGRYKISVRAWNFNSKSDFTESVEAIING